MRRARPLLWPAAVAVGIAAEAAAFEWDEIADWLPDLLVGWTLIASGLVGWSRKPAAATGPLLAATGFAWFAPNFASETLYMHRGPLVHLVLTFPYARPGSRTQLVAVVAGYVAAVVEPVWATESAAIVLALGLTGIALGSHARSVAHERILRRVALRATLAFAAAVVVTSVLRLVVPTDAMQEATLVAYEAVLSALALGLLAALVREPWSRSRVADLVIELGEGRSSSLRDALAEALGDPSLEVIYWAGDGYVDAAGRLASLPAAESGRAVTVVEREGEKVAALIHDPAVLEDPALPEALEAAARLAAANARLQAEVLAQLRELERSRSRLLRAGDEERRLLEERLRRRVTSRLSSLSGSLTGQHPDLEQQLVRVLEDLRELGAGLYPGELAGGSIADALSALAVRSPVPVELRVADMDLPQDVATVAYFACSEALANVIKHAGASHATVSLTRSDRVMRLEIADDGVGGADPRGLADRAEALGGRIVVDSPPGRGTRVTVELPLGDRRG